MAEKKNEALRKNALDSLSKQFEGRKAEIVVEDIDTIPSSKATVHRFVARAADEPNGPHATVVLDAGGKAVDLAKLSLAEGREFFAVPDFKVDLPKAVLAKLVTIDPKVNDIQLTDCGFRETITVTIPAQPIAQKVDVYFLADNTGSMTGAINSVKAGASTILSTLSLVPDIQFGVGNYRDFKDSILVPTLPAFQNQLAINANQAAVTAAINGWTASEGGDTPEAALFALDQLASVGGWRPGSLRFIVWFGDAPSHEPICASVWGGLFSIDRLRVGNDLHSNGITVLAISVNSGPGLDAASSGGYPGCPSTGPAGQATAITTATSGSLTVGVNPGAVANAILNALLTAISIHNVSLVPSGAIAPFVTSITPAGGYGPLDPTKPHTLKFDIVFERNFETCSLRDQVFTGSIDVVADHVVIAKKPTKITIPKCRYHYVAKFVCGVNEVPGEGCSPVRSGRYSTEINIYNGYCSEAVIEKRVVPVVLKGEPIGREPRVAKEMARDRIVLPPFTATMDDCCRLAELLHQPVTSNGPLTIGFLEIVSTTPLTVTAVYTATGLKDDDVSIDVEQIHEIRR
ncbi:MAG TPA: vWA domain-containing protein [Thermoanaerobaculia bacterium]|nr:vWA domain-containing protein [Thermoanaerobaculia bacterium]